MLIKSNVVGKQKPTIEPVVCNNEDTITLWNVNNNFNVVSFTGDKPSLSGPAEFAKFITENMHFISKLAKAGFQNQLLLESYRYGYQDAINNLLPKEVSEDITKEMSNEYLATIEVATNEGLPGLYKLTDDLNGCTGCEYKDCCK